MLVNLGKQLLKFLGLESQSLQTHGHGSLKQDPQTLGALAAIELLDRLEDLTPSQARSEIGTFIDAAGREVPPNLANEFYEAFGLNFRRYCQDAAFLQLVNERLGQVHQRTWQWRHLAAASAACMLIGLATHYASNIETTRSRGSYNPNTLGVEIDIGNFRCTEHNAPCKWRPADEELHFFVKRPVGMPLRVVVNSQDASNVRQRWLDVNVQTCNDRLCWVEGGKYERVAMGRLVFFISLFDFKTNEILREFNLEVDCVQ